jgi:hypothetical protein
MRKLVTDKATGQMRGILRLAVLPVLTMMPWAGCSQKANVAADAGSVGIYNLVSVDGNKVPCTVQHEGVAMAVKSGTFAIRADGTCSSKMLFAVRPGDNIDREVKASYTQEGSKLTMKWERAGTTIGTVEGDTFTMNNEGMIFAYHK